MAFSVWRIGKAWIRRSGLKMTTLLKRWCCFVYFLDPRTEGACKHLRRDDKRGVDFVVARVVVLILLKVERLWMQNRL
jgi:hypothetical protein